jgi:hypothetical protein
LESVFGESPRGFESPSSAGEGPVICEFAGGGPFGVVDDEELASYGPLTWGLVAVRLPRAVGDHLPTSTTPAVVERQSGRCAARQVRVDVDVTPRRLTIVETRPPWREDFGQEWTRFPIARLRYTKATGPWEIFWRDRNLEFHRYDLAEPSHHVADLLADVERDPTEIFCS